MRLCCTTWALLCGGCTTLTETRARPLHDFGPKSFSNHPQHARLQGPLGLVALRCGFVSSGWGRWWIHRDILHDVIETRKKTG